ncbi:MAG: ABC transporter ATP-binding protein [Candidatus Latescibacteria bacterium]|nr:ABC transporter ATP-binding protein [Candidatus Latescibacterota bacterium]
MMDKGRVERDQAAATGEPTLIIEDLDIIYSTLGKNIPAVRGVSLEIGASEGFGLVGESGSGKSTIAYAIMRYLPSNGKITNGKITFRSTNIFRLTANELLSLRGARMSLVPQEPLTSLNPSHRVGSQIAEVFRIHLDLSKEKAYERTIEMLEQVNMPDPEGMARKYPHEISGGQQQRVLIAMAFSTHPDLLIMDEPTTGLDVTTEARILDLLVEMKSIYNSAILYIAHDLGVVRRVCERVAIIYAGEIIEVGDVDTVFNRPAHGYTLGLLGCIPKFSSEAVQEKLHAIEGFLPDLSDLKPGCIFAARCSQVEDGCLAKVIPLTDIGSGHLTKCIFYQKILDLSDIVSGEQESDKETAGRSPRKESHEILLKIDDLKKAFRVGRGNLLAVDGVNLECRKGEILGIVGESGCGKTTLARCIVGLLEVDNGRILFNGGNVSITAKRRSRELHRKIQMIFQNPDSTLNPQKTVEQIINRPLTLFKLSSRKERRKQVTGLLESVKLGERYLFRYPHELSGGEKQRVGIARAFASEPELVICDEPISSLDVSVQAGIINLLIELQKEHDISYLCIGHDLNVIRHISNRIVVMYMGKICEVGTSYELFQPPYHPYTEALLSAIPILETNVAVRKIRLEGAVPSPINPGPSCRFHTRCPRKAGKICVSTPPPEIEVSPGHLIYCHIPLKELCSVPPVLSFKVT